MHAKQRVFPVLLAFSALADLIAAGTEEAAALKRGPAAKLIFAAGPSKSQLYGASLIRKKSRILSMPASFMG